MKSVYKAVAVAFVFAIMLAPAAAIFCSDNSDAAAPVVIINDTPQVTSNFSDNNSGTVKVVVKNNDTEAREVTVKIFYYGDYIDKSGSSLADKTVEIPAGESMDVYLTFSITSRGDKDLTAVAYDQEGNEYSHNNFSLNVEHSIWKNPITYVVIVLVALVIIVVIALKLRSSGVGRKGSKKADPSQPTFTQIEEERQAKKVERKSKKR